MQGDTSPVSTTQEAQPEVKNTAQVPQQPLVAPQTPSNPTLSQKPKKRLKTKVLIVLIISLALIGLGIAGYFYFNRERFVVKSGVINKDEVWSGKIHVTGDIDVMEGVTLTILPGTIVKVALTDDQHKGSGEPQTDIYFPKDPPFYHNEKITITIHGTLNAVGTPDNKIIFTSISENPTTYDWWGIDIFHGRLEYAIVEYGQGNIGIQQSSDVVMANNIIRNGLGCCIGIGHSNQVSPQILNNEIYNCGHEGIDLAGGSAIIKGNYFYLGDRSLQPDPPRGGLGMVVYKNTYPTIEDNVFERLTTAIYFHANSKYPEEQGEKVIVKDNRIENNVIAFGIDSDYLFEVVVRENNKLIGNREDETHR